jgi:pimeloyl-ACP methyl ester carboxylesterase
MHKIYVFSGLGADERVFSKIDFGQSSVHFIQWILPLKSESIASYAQRISFQITDNYPILLGISFGGIMAQEVAKFITYQKIILLASIETKDELPWYFRTVGFFKLDKLTPSFVLKSQNFISNWAFGIDSVENKKLLKAILLETNPSFLKWAIRQILIWNKTEKLNNTVCIHGTKDRILPFISTKNYDFKIDNGGHFFTLTHASEINEILRISLL